MCNWITSGHPTLSTISSWRSGTDYDTTTRRQRQLPVFLAAHEDYFTIYTAMAHPLPVSTLAKHAPP